MLPEITYSDSAKLLGLAKNSKDWTAMDHMRFDAHRDVINKREELARTIYSLTEKLKQVHQSLTQTSTAPTERYSGVNSLGEIQTMGPDIDRMCTELDLLMKFQHKLDGFKNL